MHRQLDDAGGTMRRFVLLVLLAGATMAAISVDENQVLAPGATLTMLADGFIFTEGPAADSEGNIYFTDQPNDRIMLWSRDGKLSTFMQPCGHCNGLCFDNDGKLIACADEFNQLWSIDVKTKEHSVLVKDYEGKLLNGPNDVWVRPDGGIYFTDPMYPRNYWKRSKSKQIQIEGVYYLAPDRKTLVRVVSDFTRPNGIIGTPDGKTLYVSDIDAAKTWSFSINPDGSLTGKKFLCMMGSDGMTIDDAGNVYLTNHGVTAFDPTGKQVMHVDVPQNWCGNICFAGKGSHTLFITASKAIYSIQTRTSGVGSQ
jgi:gluconolactonase